MISRNPGGSNSAVECQLPKLDVAGSTPVSRSTAGRSVFANSGRLDVKLFSGFLIVLSLSGTANAQQAQKVTHSFSKPLLTSPISGSQDKEVIISLVELPAGTSAPKHTHSGEEFAFVIEGKAIQKIGNGEPNKAIRYLLPFDIRMSTISKVNGYLLW